MFWLLDRLKPAEFLKCSAKVWKLPNSKSPRKASEPFEGLGLGYEKFDALNCILWKAWRI